MADITHGTWIKDGKAVDAAYQDGIKVYGRNLISGSYDSSWSFTSNLNATIQKVTMDSGEIALHVIGSGAWSSGFYAEFTLPSGNNTTSVEVKGTGKINKLGWQGISAAGMTPTSNWQRISGTDSFDGKVHYFVLYGTMDVYVRFLKVEKGTIATPYSIAPEDVLK